MWCVGIADLFFECGVPSACEDSSDLSSFDESLVPGDAGGLLVSELLEGGIMMC